MPNTPHSSLNLSAASFMSGNAFFKVSSQAVRPSLLGVRGGAVDDKRVADGDANAVAAGARDDRGRNAKLGGPRHQRRGVPFGGADDRARGTFGKERGRVRAPRTGVARRHAVDRDISAA